MEYVNNFDLNFTASLYHVTETPDGYGGIAKTRTLYAVIKCAFWQQSAGEQLISDRIHNPSTHTIFIKPRTDILATDEIIIDGVTYTIDRPDNIMGTNEAMTIGLTQNG